MYDQSSATPAPLPLGFTSSNASTAIHDDLRICGTCFKLYGTVVRDGARLYQSCACRRAITPPPGTRRATVIGYDVNEVVTLCKCCGLELLRDGTRWTVWFCDPCKARVRRLHEEYGAYLIPIGRHSLHGGFGLRGRDAVDQSKLRAFVTAIGSIADRMRTLDSWSVQVVQQNLETFGFSPGIEVSLLEYLGMQGAADAAKAGAFRELCAWMGVPL